MVDIENTDPELSAADSGATYHNLGSSGSHDIYLPQATVGLRFRFVVQSANSLSINLFDSGTEILQFDGYALTNPPNSSIVNSTLDVECLSSTTWTVVNARGTWTLNP